MAHQQPVDLRRCGHESALCHHPLCLKAVWVLSRKQRGVQCSGKTTQAARTSTLWMRVIYNPCCNVALGTTGTLRSDSTSQK
jgi:hypothetical protein